MTLLRRLVRLLADLIRPARRLRTPATEPAERRERCMTISILLTRSLPTRPPFAPLVVDVGRWRLAYFPELRTAWWAVAGSPRLGHQVPVGLA